MVDRRVRLALLVLALGFVAANTYQAHYRADEGHYPFPVHLDEYWHWGMATAVQRTGTAEAQDPFFGSAAEAGAGTAVAYPTQIHERGFHAYLAALQATTGIEWVVLFEFLPTIIALFTALLVFALAERWGAGVEAVLWYAAVPTSLRFLGPGFLVPISFALPLVLAGFLVATRHESRSGWVALMIIAMGLWPVHAMGALVLTGLVALYALATQATPRVALLVLALALPLLLAWPTYVHAFGAPVDRDAVLPPGLDTLRLVGPLFLTFAALGAAWVATRAEPSARASGIAIAILAAVGLMLVLLRISRDVDPLRLYDRTVTTLFPLLALLAGAGTAALWRVAAAAAGRWRAPRAAALALLLLVLTAQGAAVAAAMERNADQPYYRPLTERRYADYLAVRDVLPQQGYALVDGVDTLAFTAITGVQTAYVQTPEAPLPPPEIRRFFEEGSNDTPYLVARSITTVVTEQNVVNRDLVRIAPTVYVLRPELLQRMFPG